MNDISIDSIEVYFIFFFISIFLLIEAYKTYLFPTNTKNYFRKKIVIEKKEEVRGKERETHTHGEKTSNRLFFFRLFVRSFQVTSIDSDIELLFI